MRRSPATRPIALLPLLESLQHIRVGSSPSTRTRETRSLGVCGSKSAHCITLEMIDTVTSSLRCPRSSRRPVSISAAPDTVRAVASELEALASSALKLSWAR